MIWMRLALLMFACLCFSQVYAQSSPPDDDTTGVEEPPYDPFGPEKSPDHSGQGSGGVLTPTPYENLMQTYYTRINADYYGVQYMLDSPVQVALGTGWSSYLQSKQGYMLKLRGSGVRETQYDPLREEYAPFYHSSFEGSLEYTFKEKEVRVLKARVHALVEPKGLSMAGVGVILSKWNLLVAIDRPMNRKLELEATWLQLGGGYIMPLSPKKGGINLAIAISAELFGVKYQTYYSDLTEFLGAKIGSIGWLIGAGWNTNNLVNIGAYVNGEWAFSTGGLGLPTDKIVRADVSRHTIGFGLQATGRWFNIVGGILKEWEYLDFQKIEASEKALRYYVGVNVYVRR